MKEPLCVGTVKGLRVIIPQSLRILQLATRYHVSHISFCRLHRLHRLQKAIKNHCLTESLEILESEGFYGDSALVLLGYLQLGGAA